MKTAEEILKEYGCPQIPFDENVTMYYPAIIEAMEKYANARLQELSLTDEEIKQVSKEIFIDIDNTMDKEDLSLSWLDFYIGFNAALKWARNKLTGK